MWGAVVVVGGVNSPQQRWGKCPSHGQRQRDGRAHAQCCCSRCSPREHPAAPPPLKRRALAGRRSLSSARAPAQVQAWMPSPAAPSSARRCHHFRPTLPHSQGLASAQGPLPSRVRQRCPPLPRPPQRPCWLLAWRLRGPLTRGGIHCARGSALGGTGAQRGRAVLAHLASSMAALSGA